MKLVPVSLVMAVALVSAQVAWPARPSVVRVKISPNLRITFAPNAVKRGLVVFKVKNASLGPHEFSINGITTKPIPRNATVSLKVKLKRPAVYSATLADCGLGANNASTCPTGVPSGNIKVT